MTLRSEKTVLFHRDYIVRQLAIAAVHVDINPIINPDTDEFFNYVCPIEPSPGVCPYRYDVVDRLWYDSSCNFGYASLCLDGKLLVGFTDETEGGMAFQITHPREAFEIINLLCQGAAFFARPVELDAVMALSEVAEFRIVLPNGHSWLMLDPAHPPEGASGDFIAAILKSVSTDDIHLQSMYEEYTAAAICTRWPEMVSALPDAQKTLQEGYIVQWNGELQSGYDVILNETSGTAVSAQLLLLPRPDNQVSWLCLKEYLSHDLETVRQMNKIIENMRGLTLFLKQCGQLMLHMPGGYMSQIRYASEINMLREWVTYEARSLRRQRRPFGALQDLHWSAANALHQLNNQKYKGNPP